MTIKKTVKEFRESGLIENARRLPFTDNMIVAIDKDLKFETRRPMKYKYDGGRGKCPYGKEAGTLLLVTGVHVFLNQERKIITELHSENSEGQGLSTLYRADCKNNEWSQQPRILKRNWRNAMYMPKWAPTRYLISRFVEPAILTDITEEQAIAEGVEVLDRGDRPPAYTFYGSNHVYQSAVEAFEHGWNSIHGDRGLYFHTGPEVWRIGFERLVVE